MKKFILSALSALGTVGALGTLGISGLVSANEPTVLPKTAIVPFVVTEGNNQEARRGGFQVGVGIYYMKPVWNGNQALTTSTQSIIVNGGALTATTSSSTSDFEHNYSFAPRVWAGYVGECGLGIRLGWWRFGSDASAGATITPQIPGNPIVSVTAPGLGTIPSNALAPGQTGTFLLDNRIEFNVFDLDITQRLLDNDRWNLTVGAGVRYLIIDQAYSGSTTFTGFPAGVVIRNNVANRNEFDGIGPNLVFDANRRLGNFGLGLYASGRFGVLFGDSRQESLTSSFQAAGAASVSISNATLTTRDNLVPFLDVETGVQWQGCGKLRPFARIGITGQNYFGVGSANVTNGNLGFFGGTFATGINW